MGSGNAGQCQGHSESRLAVVAAVASLMGAYLDLIADSVDNQCC
jgi:hypothetical protein